MRNHTGWPVQLFHGPTNGPKLRHLFSDLLSAGSLTLTNLGDDYMEDWQRLSSMMLLDVFWKAVVGRKARNLPRPRRHISAIYLGEFPRQVLIFQPDAAMCLGSDAKIAEFLQYDYVGAPMAGAWWGISDHPSQARYRRDRDEIAT